MKLLDKPYTQKEVDNEVRMLQGNICRICVSDDPEEIIRMAGFADDRIAMLAYSRIKSLKTSDSTC